MVKGEHNWLQWLDSSILSTEPTPLTDKTPEEAILADFSSRLALIYTCGRISIKMAEALLEKIRMILSTPNKALSDKYSLLIKTVLYDTK